ncbi:MAG: hypothetical protein Q7J33_08645 [Serpentinimonas sp.]|nr:hypothetical protein [Serpentinimonas sp.]
MQQVQIEMQEDMRGHGISQPNTHISPPLLGQGRYGPKRTSLLGSKAAISILG